MTKATFALAFLCLFAGVENSLAANPQDFSADQIETIWVELWKSGDVYDKAPEIDKLTEKDTLLRISGKWVVPFGVSTNHMAVVIETNRTARVSGEQDGKSWNNNGQWRLIDGKIVLFLERDSIPSFIFKKEDRVFIFDPWAKTMMSELKRGPYRKCKVCGATFLHGSEDIDGDTLDSSAKTFHHYGLHGHAESYIVGIKKAKLTGGPKNEVQLEATIIEQIKGDRKRGEKLVFTRVFDAGPQQVEKFIRSTKEGRWCVFLEARDERVEVNPQDPGAMIPLTDDLKRVIGKHGTFCEKAGKSKGR